MGLSRSFFVGARTAVERAGVVVDEGLQPEDRELFRRGTRASQEAGAYALAVRGKVAVLQVESILRWPSALRLCSVRHCT